MPHTGVDSFSIDGRSGKTDVVNVNSHLEDAGPPAMQQDLIVFHRMLANSLAVVVAEEAAKRLLLDMNLEHRPKRAERMGFFVAKSLALVQADTWAEREVARDIYELDELLEPAEVSTLTSLEKLVEEIANTGHLLAV